MLRVIATEERENEKTGVECLENVSDLACVLRRGSFIEDFLVGVEKDDTTLDQLQDHIISSDMFEDTLRDVHLLLSVGGGE